MSKEQIKLVLVYPTDPNVEIMGGGTRYMRYLLRQALKKGVRVKFVGVKLNYCKKNSSDYTFIPLVKGSDKWWRYFVTSLFKVPFLGLAPDEIIHAQRLLYLLPYVIFYHSNPKICTSDQPLVAASTRYSTIIFRILSLLYFPIERLIMNRVDAILADKRVLKDYYESRYPGLKHKLQTNVNPAAGVDTERFRLLDYEAIRKNFGIANEERIVMFVGRLSPVKRVNFLIDAFVDFNKSVPNSRFLIVGRGESENTLKEYSSHYPNHSIEFLGEKRGEELVKLYNCADVLVLASVTEGNPTVFREALACGGPVVSTDVGDAREILWHPNLGRVVSNDDCKAFARAINEVLLQGKKKVRKACRLESIKFSEGALFQSVFRLYKRIAESKDIDNERTHKAHPGGD